MLKYVLLGVVFQGVTTGIWNVSQIKGYSGDGLSQCETTLQCNVVSHWLSYTQKDSCRPWNWFNTRPDIVKDPARSRTREIWCLTPPGSGTVLVSSSNQYIRWRHQMETFSALLALCEGNPPVTGGFPSQRPVTRSFEVFLWSAPKQTVEQTIETLVIWSAIAPIMTPL